MASFRIKKDLKSDTLNTREIYHRTVADVDDITLTGFLVGTNELVEVVVPDPVAATAARSQLGDITQQLQQLKEQNDVLAAKVAALEQRNA
jgi:hypothetical protein